MADKTQTQTEDPMYRGNYDPTQENTLEWNAKHGDRAGVVEKDENTAVRPAATSAAKAKKGKPS
jgi:hypothetical protein